MYDTAIDLYEVDELYFIKRFDQAMRLSDVKEVEPTERNEHSARKQDFDLSRLQREHAA